MKNLSSILLGIFCLALAGLTFSSCRGNEGGEEIKPDYDSSISVWYKEFENIKDYGIFGYYTWGYNHRIPELKLTDYTYKGIYDTPEKLAQLREAIFSDNTYVPVYRNGLETFSLETWDQIMERNAANVNRDVKIAKIDSLLKTNPEVVELHWTYNDNLSFTTHALVTPFAINYDNILWNLIYGYGIRSTNPADLQRNVLRTKSSSENDENDVNPNVYYSGSDYTFVGVFEKKTKGFNAISPSMF